jgi:hypothetical protein
MSGFSQKKLPEYAERKRRRQVDVIQLPLPDLDEKEQHAASSS